jgi:hypothetical protein
MPDPNAVAWKHQIQQVIDTLVSRGRFPDKMRILWQYPHLQLQLRSMGDVPKHFNRPIVRVNVFLLGVRFLREELERQRIRARVVISLDLQQEVLDARRDNELERLPPRAEALLSRIERQVNLRTYGEHLEDALQNVDLEAKLEAEIPESEAIPVTPKQSKLDWTHIGPFDSVFKAVDWNNGHAGKLVKYQGKIYHEDARRISD